MVKYDETVEGMPPPGIIYILHITIYDVNQEILLVISFDFLAWGKLKSTPALL